MMGATVPFRGLLLIGTVAALLAGCANERAMAPSALGASVQAAQLSGRQTVSQEEADLKRAARQTVSAKMLAAIALERVTGRTPDPSRFNELR